MKKSFDQNNNHTQRIIVGELSKKATPRFNKIVLGSFLLFCILVVLFRILVSILLDMGLYSEKFHFAYWLSPETSFGSYFKEWKEAQPVGSVVTFNAFLDANPDLSSLINSHPAMFWWLTQFTWLTTIIIVVFLTFRFFGMTDRVPKWLKWVMSQRTLSHIAMWDLLVASGFWIGLAQSFASGYNNTLLIPEYIITGSVHAVIPLCIAIYAVIYLVKDPKASLLKEFFALKGLLFPFIYSLFYLLLTIIWYDPYAFTQMNDKLVSGGWGSWATELWKVPIGLFIIYLFLGLLTIIHNVILIRFNKNYDPEHDFEAIKRRELKLSKIRGKIIKNQVNIKINKIKNKK